ncbi:lysophospholipid acyltransferase family protein [Oceanomicrobium pacificus]|uniref:Lauroyl acyltransferase n=1 Tax=Oceanomicrobium pacificus TaxID=2692916 RepID=A0A6B0TVH9_9RHOB|nr:lauroyl acyltransferase [Oceanomicrobium pacificus]MXU65558.1 lauroyl acyltransferase [Oceanomicrobium pacificus]
MASTRRHSFGDYLITLGIRFLIFLSGLLPFRLRSRFGGAISKAIILTVPAFRRRISRNLDMVWPDRDAGEKRAILREVAGNTGRTYAEIFHGQDLLDRTDGFEIEGPGLAAVLDAQAEGRGAVLVGGHFGQWEAVRSVLLKRGINCAGFYRPNNNEYYDPYFLDAIETFGKPVFARDRAGTRDMVRHLRGGGVAALLVDQSIKTAPVFRFMGLPAQTGTLAADLALRYGLPLVPAYGVRDADDPVKLTVVMEAPIPHTDVDAMTQAVNDSLDAMVRTHPGQWYWLHQRWKLHKRVQAEAAAHGAQV